MKKLILTLLCVNLTSQLNAHDNRLIEGKTKIIWQCPDDERLVIVESKDNITSGDGYARRDVIEGKAKLATDTTCNVFELLKTYHVPIAYCQQLSDTKFLAPRCTMVEYEVVVRREAHGSYLKRNPHLRQGQLFPQLKIEFFLKTSNRNWRGTAIPKDDPFIKFTDNGSIELYLPDQPIWSQKPFMVLDDYPLKDRPELFAYMETVAKQTFLILEKAWQQAHRRLVDFKVEFGFDTEGNLLLADVIDNDSWRVVQDGIYIDKQAYRDGADLNEVTRKYTLVRNVTAQFKAPRQRIIVWRASEQDDIAPFLQALEPCKACGIELVTVTKSMHKQPVEGYQILANLVQEVPDSVLLVYVGRSNGAGPTLSAATCIPVITVPAGFKDFPEDVWSSIRTPSDTPVMTVLEPANAVLAALEILALRNPGAYAYLHAKQEKRLINICPA